MNKKLLIFGTCAALAIGILFGTDPIELPAFMLVVPFILLGVMLFLGISFVLDKAGLPRKKATHITVFATALPLILLVLQSVGQLTVRDVLTLSIIFLLSYFYVSRTLLSK